jgi:LmbE family N-acetylglucosaminyl deacetylase
MKTYPHRTPATLVSLALLLAASLAAPAQITAANDPANLTGERVSPPDLSDTLPLNHGAPALEQLLRKLRTRASFMLIVAHPDDEDNGMLTYLSRGQGARVATLTLNRGEGGQNLMSADFDDALGLIRTQELLAADRYMDVDQFFGTEVDFGFSKTKEEAFAKWTHDRVLYDAVRAIRLYRPLVIASVFIGEPSDGHGQHQVSGQIAQEAFKAAGDPKVFPDQIAAGLQPWQPLKVYARSPFGRIDAQGMYDYATSQYVPARFENYVTGKVTDTVPKANVVVPEGDTDPLLGGQSYAQVGRTGRALQKSQIGGGAGGPGGSGPGGRADVSYHRYGSKLHQPDGDDSGLESGFYDGIDTTLPGIASLAPASPAALKAVLQLIDMKIADAQKQFDPANPAAIAEPLRIALQTLDTVISGTEGSPLPPDQKLNLLHELRIKRVQLNNALVLAHGYALKATVTGNPAKVSPPEGSDSMLTVDDRVAANVVVSVAGSDGANLLDAGVSPLHGKIDTSNRPPAVIPKGFQGDPSAHPFTFAPGHPNSTYTFYTLDRYDTTQPATKPYFSRPNIEQPYYDIAEPNLRNAPATPHPLEAYAYFDDQGVRLEIRATPALPGPSHSFPVVVEPPVSVSVSPAIAILRDPRTSFEVTVHLSSAVLEDRPNRNRLPNEQLPTQAVVKLRGNESIRVEPSEKTVTLPGPGEVADVSFQVTPVNIAARQPLALVAVASYDGKEYTEGFRAVGYTGLTPTNYYTPADYKAVPVDVTTAPNLNIAYIPGTGDDVPSALEQLGVHAHLLTATNLTPESLKPYDAVVLGVRAYGHRELAAANAALNEYASEGGVVIAQYNTGRLPDGTGPYALDLGGSATVVEEDAPVKIVAPDNPLLTWPNKITTADFDHWVEERGHGFMATWDPHYTPLLETHDHGQQPQLGGLLVARTGRGAWIYLGLALYRQLPEGVPGSYRLLANLISAARNPALNSVSLSAK